METGIKTVKELPQHHAVGRFFRAWDGQVYYCECYDPRVDYIVVNVVDPTIRKDISPRAIGRTFHGVMDDWHPLPDAELRGTTYYAVDTRVAAGELTCVEMLDKDAIGIDERVALFVWEPEATRFIRHIQEAAQRLNAEREAKVACAA